MNPLNTRTFHVNLHDQSGKLWQMNIAIEQENIEELKQSEEITNFADHQRQKILSEEGVFQHFKPLSGGTKKSDWELEYEVIRSIAEQALQGAPKKAKKKDRSLDITVSKTAGSDEIIFTSSNTKGITQSFTKVEITQEAAPKARLYKAIQCKETTDYRPLLTQFSRTPYFGTGSAGKIRKALHPFFTKLGQKFQKIDIWWKNTIGISDMPYHLEMLASCIGVEGDDVPLHEALHYMTAMTLNSHPEIGKRLLDGVQFSKMIEQKKKKYQSNTGKKTQKRIEKFSKKECRKILLKIQDLPGDKEGKNPIILPIKLNQHQECLLTISKTRNGAYTLSFYHDDPSKNFQVRTSFENLTTIIEQSISSQLLEATNASNPYQTLHNELFPLRKERMPHQKSAFTGNIETIRSVVNKALQQEAFDTSSYTDIGLRIRLFIDMCHASQDWLANPNYHKEVQYTCYQLIEKTQKILQESLPYKQSQDLGALVTELQKILLMTKQTAPEISMISNSPLLPIGEGRFPNLQELPEAVDELTPKPLEVNWHIHYMAKGSSSEKQSLIKKNGNYRNSVESAMRKTLQYSGSIIDANVVQDKTRKRFFPCFDQLKLTKNEELALIYTLHSQQKQSHTVSSLSYGHNTENIARANYTLQTLVDHPTIGRSEQVQHWISHQLFTEKRIELLLRTSEGKESIEQAIQQMTHQASLLIETPSNFSNYVDNITAALYLIRTCKKIVKESQDTIALPQDFSDVINEQLLQLARYSDQENIKQAQGIFFGEYFLSLKEQLMDKSLSPEQLSDTQIANCLVGFCRVDIKSIKNQQLQDAAKQLQPLIYTIAREKIEDGTLNCVQKFCAKVGGEAAKNADQKWEVKEFPILTATTDQGQEITLDLVSGEIFTGGRRAARLPKELSTDPHIQRLFPNAQSMFWNILSAKDIEGITAYEHPEKSIRIVVTEQEEEEDEVDVKIEKFINKEWVPYHRFAAQDCLAQGLIPTEKDDDLPHTIASAIGNRNCWTSRDGRTIYVSDPVTENLYGIYSQDTGGKFTLTNGTTLLEPNSEAMQAFSSLEDASRLIVYGTGGIPERIEYPLLPVLESSIRLSYEITHSDKGPVASSINFPGWTLATPGKLPGQYNTSTPLPDTLPPGFTAFQLLEKDGQQKVLIPGRELVSLTPSLAKGTYTTRGVPAENFGSSPLYEFSVDPNTNRLKTSNPEAYFHLAYLSLFHQDLEAALYYLQKAQEGVGDTEQFATIAEYIQNYEPLDPNTALVQLKMLCFAENIRKRRELEIRQKTQVTQKEREEAEIHTPSPNPYIGKIVETGEKINFLDLDIWITLTQSEKQILQECGVSIPHFDVEMGIAALESQIPKAVEVSGTEEQRVASSIENLNLPSVLGRDLQQAVQEAFIIKDKPAPEVDKSFFYDLEGSEDLAVARVAKTHRQDLEASLQEKKAAFIEKDRAVLLLEQMKTQQRALQEKKEHSIQNALFIIAPTQKAGKIAARQMMGKSAKAETQMLVQMWISGNFISPKNQAYLSRIAKRPITDQEMQDLDWAIIDFLKSESDLKHIERVIASGQKYVESCDEEIGDPSLSQSFYELATTKRAFTLVGSQCEEIGPRDFALIACKDPASLQAIIDGLHTLQPPKKVSRDDFLKMISNIEKEILQSAQRTPPNTDAIHQALEKLQSIGKKKEGEKLFASYQFYLRNQKIQRIFSKGASDSDYQEMLALEYVTGFILRENQISTFRDMLENPNNVRQLGMGGGKSKVLLPLLAKRKATGKNLVALLLPDALYETNRRDLDRTNRELFGQNMYCFEYSRSSDIQSEDLKEIRKTLLKTIRDKGFIATKKSSMLSFRNAYLTKVRELPTVFSADKREEAIAQISEMAKILQLFKERMDVIADEVDEVLNVRKEVNFAQGDPEKIHPIKSEVGLECIQIIDQASTPHLAELKSRLLINSQAKMPSDNRKQALMRLAAIYYDKHAEEINNCPDKDTFVQYVTRDPNVKDLPPFMEKLLHDSLETYQRIATLKAFLTRGFSMTFGKTANVDYGRNPDPERPFTIPFKASNEPAIGSEFDDDIERIAYELQCDYQTTVNFPIVREAIATFTKQIHSEKKALQKTRPGEKISIKDTASYKSFAKLARLMDPTGETISQDITSYATSEESIEKLVAEINSSAFARVVFCKTYIVDQKIKIFPDQVSSKAEDLVDMVHAFGGFTGTPWNLHTFHDKIQAERNLGVDGRTYQLLLSYNCPVKTIPFNPQKPIDSLLHSIDREQTRAVIDTGAYLQGIPNSKFINRAMQGAKESAVGVYFDKSGKIVGRTASGDIIPATKLKNDALNTRFTLYDQAHTVGADIKQSANAVAAVTVGEATTIRDLFQAVWRLRQLHEGQRVEFIITEEIKALMGKEQYEEINIKDILAFCLRNEVSREADDNYRAEMAKIKGMGSRTMFDSLVDFGASLDPNKTETSIEKMNEFSSALSERLVKKRAGDEAFNDYAAVSQESDPLETLEHARKKAQQLLQEVIDDVQKIKPEHKTKTALNILSENLSLTKTLIRTREDRNPNLFPPTVSSSNTNANAMAEAEAEAEAQVEAHALMTVEAEEEEETQEIGAEDSIKEAYGNTKVTGAPVTHRKIGQLATEGLMSLKKQCDNSLEEAGVCNLQHICGVFDANIFIGATYEGKMKNPEVYQDDEKKQSRWNEIGKPGNTVHNHQATKSAKSILHTERLPINEALFFKGDDGQWRAIFGSTHDSYPSFQTYPCKRRKAASLVKIGRAGPCSVTRNEGFKNMDPADKKAFMRLFVQVKFLKGEFHFDSKEEQEALKEWIQEKGAKDMQLFFEKVIRPTKQGKDQLGYRDSSLKILFTELTDE